MTTSAEDDAPTLGSLRAGLDARPGIVRKRPWRQRLRLPLMLLGPIVVLLGGVYWYLTTGRYVSTDDAYVQAARVSISTDVSGRVAAIDVRDNEEVKAGQVLFTLDQRPFVIAVEEAKAQLAAVRLQVEAMKATYQQKLAEARAIEATVAYERGEFERQKQLLASGAASRQQFDRASQAFQTDTAQLASKEQDVANTLASLGGQRADSLQVHFVIGPWIHGHRGSRARHDQVAQQTHAKPPTLWAKRTFRPHDNRRRYRSATLPALLCDPSRRIKKTQAIFCWPAGQCRLLPASTSA